MGGITEAILLVALGVGYMVCYLAKREEKTFKALGYLIGTFIIVLSALLILSSLLLAARFCNRMGKGMMMPHKMMMKGQMPMPAIPAQPETKK